MKRAVVLALALAVGRLPLGCASDAPPVTPEAPDAAPDAREPDAAEGDASSVDAELPDPKPPAGLPEGWVLDRTYDRFCHFYVPTSRAYLPKPIAWEACPATATPQGGVCRKMTVDWAPSNRQFPLGTIVGAWADASGAVRLVVRRSLSAGWGQLVVADADGAVHSALLETKSTFCAATWPTISGAHYVYYLTEFGSSVGGAIGGEISAIGPTFGIHYKPPEAEQPFAGPDYIASLVGSRVDRYSWSGQREGTLWRAVDDDGLQHHIPQFGRNAAFMHVGRLYEGKIKVSVAGAPMKDLIVGGPDFTHDVADIGTDGTDLVWMDGRGRTSPTGPYDTYTVMTSPFATQPSQLVERRLRSEEGPAFGSAPFVVGCGHAARTNLHTRLVRLSDGVSWLLNGDPAKPWRFITPLAITCTELFATVNDGGVVGVARIRLDSLGPGIPPD
ncbi:MAG: hypothetical protein KC657_14535 [Myxococcales bacterium]|nr:hypothetical protein [Myxococcales bacterium]